MGSGGGLTSSPSSSGGCQHLRPKSAISIVEKARVCIDDGCLAGKAQRPRRLNERQRSAPAETVATELRSSRAAACSLLADIVDFDQADEGMIISHGVCCELDDLKHAYHGLPDFLTRVVEAELARIPRELRYGLAAQLWTMMYMPQV